MDQLDKQNEIILTCWKNQIIIKKDTFKTNNMYDLDISEKLEKIGIFKNAEQIRLVKKNWKIKYSKICVLYCIIIYCHNNLDCRVKLLLTIVNYEYN